MSATFFENKSVSNVSAVEVKVTGRSMDHNFTIESVKFGDEDVNDFTRISFDLTDLYNQITEFNLIENYKKKIVSKFKKFEDVEVEEGFINIIFENEEVATNNKKAIKMLTRVDKIAKIVTNVATAMNKLIATKAERKRLAAEKKAAKQAAAKMAATAIPSATAAEI